LGRGQKARRWRASRPLPSRPHRSHDPRFSSFDNSTTRVSRAIPAQTRRTTCVVFFLSLALASMIFSQPSTLRPRLICTFPTFASLPCLIWFLILAASPGVKTAPSRSRYPKRRIEGRGADITLCSCTTFLTTIYGLDTPRRMMTDGTDGNTWRFSDF
jgi:hypothetical protein